MPILIGRMPPRTLRENEAVWTSHSHDDSLFWMPRDAITFATPDEIAKSAASVLVDLINLYPNIIEHLGELRQQIADMEA